MVIIILTRRGDDLKGAVPFFKFPLDEDDEVGEKMSMTDDSSS